jgi:RHS repeat-associated protein
LRSNSQGEFRCVKGAGRLTDLHFKNGSDQTLHRYEYGYDAAGNRNYAKVKQWPTDGGLVPHDNDRSYAYGYDKLNRLIRADRGQLPVDAGRPAPETDGQYKVSAGGAVVPNLRDWTLDNLGNWTGDGTAAGLVFGDDPDDARPIANASSVTHTVNSANQVTGTTKDTVAGPGIIHDKAGNIVSDGVFYMQYDAFHRLVQVNKWTWVSGDMDDDGDVDDTDFAAFETCYHGPTLTGACAPADLDNDGDLDADDLTAFQACRNGPNSPPAHEGCYKHPTLDGDGRITSGRPGALVVRYVYDGLGRLIRKEGPTQPLNPASPMRTEDYYYDGVRRIQEDVTPPAPATAWTDRQYVYGPDYVDEFVAQIDKGDTQHPTGRLFYMLQDANYNVVALVGLVGGTWQVVEQYTYEPYGAVVAVDDLVPGSHPVNRVGHQGLFYEHLDGGWGLQPGSIGLYYNRNRWYSPALGRFISRDPNETALPTLAFAMNAQALSILADRFSAAGHFADGMNLYVCLGSNPVNHRDPRGLSLLLDTTAAQSEALWMNFTATMGATAAGFAGMVTYGVMQGMSLENAAIDSANIALEYGLASGISEAFFLSAEYTALAASTRALRNRSLLTVGAGRAITPLVSDLTADTVACFEGGVVRTSVTKAQTVLYRVWGMESGRVGSWLTRKAYTSASEAIKELALPPGNSAAFITEVVVPDGVPLYEGAAARAFGQPGLGNQIFVPIEWLRDAWFTATRLLF